MVKNHKEEIEKHKSELAAQLKKVTEQYKEEKRASINLEYTLTQKHEENLQAICDKYKQEEQRISAFLKDNQLCMKTLEFKHKEQ